MNIITPFLIVSVELSILDRKQNDIRTEQVRKVLQGSPYLFREVNGVYKGINERAFIIFWYPDVEQLVQSIAADYKQECYLYIDANRRGTLHSPNGTMITQLGTYKLSKERPNTENYTIDNGTYLYF